MSPPDLRAAAELLEVDPDAPEDQIRKQHRLLIHLFAPDSPVVYGLYTRDEARRLVERLDAACATLTTAARRPPPDRARRPDNPAPSLPPAPAPAADRIHDPLTALGLPPDTPHRGDLIHRVRHLLGLHLEEIADRTKIGVFTLRCIETETWPDLPAKVYLKGFLRQIAPLLRLDPERLTRDYLAAFDAWEHDNRRKKRW